MLVKSRLLYTGGVGGMELKDEVEIKFVSEGFPGISLFRGRDKREQSEKACRTCRRVGVCDKKC